MNENKLILSLVALVWIIFAVVLIINFNSIITGLAVVPLGLYFALISWSKIGKSNSVFFSCLILISLAMGIEIGLTSAFIFTLLIVVIVNTAIHYCFAGSKAQ